MTTANNEPRRATTPEERLAAKKARKEHRGRIRLIIETYEWLINCHARAGRVDKCQEMADKMINMARESPEDFGRWKSVQVQVS